MPIIALDLPFPLYRDLIEGRTVPAKRRATWMDVAMRLAVRAYWRDGRAAA